MTDRLEHNLRRYHAISARDFSDDRRRLMRAIVEAQAAGRSPSRRAGGLSLVGAGAEAVRTARAWWTRMAPLSAAAAVAAAIAVWFVAGADRDEILSARVLASLQDVRTMNVDMQTYRGNTMLRHTQVWFERDVGFSQHTAIGESMYVTVANNQYTWRHQAGGQTVARMKNFKYVTDPAQFRLEGLEFGSGLEGPARRDPAGDEHTDEGVFRMYVLRDGDATLRLWLDGANLVRAFERQQPRGRASEVTYARIEYDVPIETTHFEPSYPAHAVVVAPEAYLERTFPLEGAVYQHEAAGLVFAVHDLQRLDDHTGYMVTSVRLDEAFEPSIDNDDPWNYFGDVIDLRPNRGHAQLRSAVTGSTLLARMKVGDLIVHWHLLGLQPARYVEAQSSPFLIRVAAAESLRSAVRKQGRADDVTIAAMLPVPGTRAGQSMESFLGDLHAKAQQWTPLTHYFALLEVVPVADGGRVAYRWRDPNLFSAGQFIQHTLERLPTVQPK